MSGEKVNIVETYKLELNKEEFALVTKALTGALRPEDRDAGHRLGQHLLHESLSRVRVRGEALEHAISKTK